MGADVPEACIGQLVVHPEGVPHLAPPRTSSKQRRLPVLPPLCLQGWTTSGAWSSTACCSRLAAARSACASGGGGVCVGVWGEKTGDPGACTMGAA